MDKMTLWEQSTNHLVVRHCDHVVRVVDDSYDVWLCTDEAWCDARKLLAGRPAYDGDDADATAYGTLRSAIASPIASALSTSRGNYAALVADAVREGLIDAEEAQRRYGVEVAT